MAPRLDDVQHTATAEARQVRCTTHAPQGGTATKEKDMSTLWGDPEIEPAEHICENCKFWSAPLIPEDTGDCQRVHTGLTDGDAFEDEDWAQTEATDTCNRWMQATKQTLVTNIFDIDSRLNT